MKLEVLENNKFYHIYNRGINGTTIFASDENKRYFLKLYLKYLENKADTFAYCLMENHFHFVIRVIKEEEITQALSNLLNAYAKAFNKQSDRTGSLFEKHFKRIQIESQTYLTNLIQYVHLNPTHHLDIDYKTYPFSSYQSMISNQPTKLVRDEVLAYFEGVENFIYCHDFKKEIISERLILE